MKKLLFAVLIVAVLAGIAAFTGYEMWQHRQTRDEYKAECKSTRKALRAAAPQEVVGYLRNLSADCAMRFRFFNTKDLRVAESYSAFSPSFGPKVSYDFIALLTEEAFIRFAGDTKTDKAQVDKTNRELIAFAGELLDGGKLSKDSIDSLRERRLDAYFLIGDYDSAIVAIEAGLPGHSAAWCKGTAAKLRAHKAMDAGDKKEAIKQLLVFGDMMLSDEMKDFEDADPANGVVYSREWVVAKNYMRCAVMSGEMNDAKAKADFTAKAKPLYAAALEKLKDDEVSRKELQKEMKQYGL